MLAFRADFKIESIPSSGLCLFTCLYRTDSGLLAYACETGLEPLVNAIEVLKIRFLGSLFL